MRETIDIAYKGQHYEIPNSWNALSADDFRFVAEELGRMALGETSPGAIRLHLLCRLMGWKLRRVTDEDAMGTLLVLASQLTFLFLIDYGKDNDLIADLSPEDQEYCRRIDPWQSQLPIARALRRLDYRYIPDLCFASQKVPTISASGKTYKGYTILCDDNALTTSLTALQFLEAQQLLQRIDCAQPEKVQRLLVLLAAILYFPGERYSSEAAHRFAQELKAVDPITLQCIMLNFRAFTAFLFERTPFSLLTKFKGKTPAAITTDGIDALYDLAKDGLGSVGEVEQINLITYFRLMRKKTIDAVRQMKDLEWDLAKISKESGLPIRIVESITQPEKITNNE